LAYLICLTIKVAALWQNLHSFRSGLSWGSADKNLHQGRDGCLSHDPASGSKESQSTDGPINGVGPFPYSFIVPVLFFGVAVAFLWMMGLRHNGGLPGLQFMIAFFLLTGKAVALL